MSYLSKEYLAALRQPKQTTVSIAFFSLSTVSVCMRLLSRRLVHANIQWDDILILCAWMIYIGLFALDFVSFSYGSGRHVEAVSFSSVKPLLICTYIGELAYPIVLTAIKCSIICLYLRLFGINSRFVLWAKVTMGFAIAWGITTLFPPMFQCIPVYMTWDLYNPKRRCLAIKPYFLATNTCEVVIDFVILLLPMPQVWNLKLSTQRKLGVTTIFFLGAFTSVVGIIRLIVVVRINQTDITWNYLPLVEWSTVQINVGIVCACLPVISPVMRLVLCNCSKTIPKPSFLNASTPAGASAFGNDYSLSTLLATEPGRPLPSRDEA